MAADLMNHVALRCLGWGGVCAMLASLSAHALTDPTQPPAEISSPAVRGKAASTAEENGLQAVILSVMRHAAIIDGQTLELGANLGDAKLIEVDESGVVLQGSQGKRRLSLFPGVEIKKEEALLPMEIEVKSATRKARLKKPARRPGIREAK